MSPDAKSPEVNNILSAERLELLKQAYDRAMMTKVATTTAAAPYAGSQGFIGEIGARLYAEADQPDRLTAKDRERVLIALLAAGHRPAFAQAIHYYWALMEGLSVDDIAETLLAVGCYSGVDALTDAVFNLGETLRILDKLAQKGGDAVGSGVVLGTMVKAFRGSPSASVE